MLGCQDFCGYYDWTFHYLRHHVHPDAAHRLWREAIAQAQRHYTDAGLERGLRGLYETWAQTGEDEQCDWTFTLDEQHNLLRIDMRECPSKGHLIENDLYADEDYCDHCMGWIQPMLEQVGGEVVEHEHNHCGQCWWEMRLKDKPCQSAAGHESDITNDPRWQRGHIDRWASGVKLPLLKDATDAVDPADVLRDWFADNESLTVLGRGPSAADVWTAERVAGQLAEHAVDPVIVTDATYAQRDVYTGEPRGVLLGDDCAALDQVAERFHATPSHRRPLLMHTYLPRAPMQAFAGYGLPRPVSILPLLVRESLYRHEPFAPYPTTGVFAVLLVAALGKRITVAGVDLYRHPSGQAYVNDQSFSGWPAQHSEACDRQHLHLASRHLGDRMVMHPFLDELLKSSSAQR